MQLKRIFGFAFIHLIAAVFAIVAYLEVVSFFGIDSNEFIKYIGPDIVGHIVLFVVLWLFSRGVNSKPYLHSFAVYIISLCVSSLIMFAAMKELFYSSFDFLMLPVTVICLLLATYIGQKNKDVHSNVS